MEVFFMKLRKTLITRRMTYTYFFENGDRVILEPGVSTTIRASGDRVVQIDESITEITIKQLHQIDDADVRADLKNVN
jgi:hypothetical protein